MPKRITISDLNEKYGEDNVNKALDEADKKNATSIVAYANVVLERWARDGIIRNVGARNGGYLDPKDDPDKFIKGIYSDVVIRTTADYIRLGKQPPRPLKSYNDGFPNGWHKDPKTGEVVNANGEIWDDDVPS